MIRKRLKGRNLMGEPKHSAGNGQSKTRRKAGFRAEFILLYLCGNHFARDCPLYAISTEKGVEKTTFANPMQVLSG